MAEQITDSAFEESVLKADLPVLVDFWAPWCGPCRAVGPVVDKLSKEFEGRMHVYKMNVDENPATPAKYSIRAIPTLILFRNGEVLSQQTGALPEPTLRKLMESAL